MASRVRSALNSKPLLWTALALPAAYLLFRLVAEDLWPDELVGPTGEWAARLIIVTLMLTPLSLLLPRTRIITWMARRRRAFGVAAFAYAALHLTLYVAEMETVRNILAEFWELGIWTGWAAFLLLVPLAVTSNDASLRALKGGWKKLHRLAYPAALFVLVHWIIVHDGLVAALVQFAPLALLETWRMTRLATHSRPVHSTS